MTAGGVGDAATRPIGPYRLLQLLGEGGMGEVWLAEQVTPIRRTVALKLIKAGMDTKAVVARFESERQALALMDHPNIAHVYDAGTTPEGRPYFVMEYVPGLPITDYCDRHTSGDDSRPSPDLRRPALCARAAAAQKPK
jgi:non-specific serine/threonine protein kinase/serine/threonine-protein kinase